MAYFGPKFIPFFKGLAANNSREYFDDNRKTYEQEVKKPFQLLIRDLIEELGEREPDIKNLQVKDAVFRINRDIRFSKDKSPYNLHLSAVVSPFGRKDMQYPGLYLMLSVEKCMFGGGMYMPDKENLYKIRQYIIDHPDEIAAALNHKDFKEVYGELAPAEKNKKLPEEFKEHALKYPMLFMKQFYYMAEHAGEPTIMKDDLRSFIANHYYAAGKWNTIFKKAIGINVRTTT